ncbi:hypothetical protein PYCCODRAFT_1429176 [Trametes coccinea BRFM310]|uniref:Uncharacterized protein n=1 Tax=Trametes coccinea (strain BRFM310) TaxID=1353009 RepID=A0A1Y2I582_TRAC3|nr:hypothetical protein PYCCODRAFT_1429176 [Trametes coccinea BRFM310]
MFSPSAGESELRVSKWSKSHPDHLLATVVQLRLVILYPWAGCFPSIKSVTIPEKRNEYGDLSAARALAPHNWDWFQDSSSMQSSAAVQRVGSTSSSAIIASYRAGRLIKLAQISITGLTPSQRVFSIASALSSFKRFPAATSIHFTSIYALSIDWALVLGAKGCGSEGFRRMHCNAVQLLLNSNSGELKKVLALQGCHATWPARPRAESQAVYQSHGVRMSSEVVKQSADGDKQTFVETLPPWPQLSGVFVDSTTQELVDPPYGYYAGERVRFEPLTECPRLLFHSIPLTPCSPGALLSYKDGRPLRVTAPQQDRTAYCR